MLCVTLGIYSSCYISSICVADIFRDEFKTVSSEITTIHIALKRTETLGCFGGKPTPNCLCQVTQTAFQFVYKLESG